MVYIVETTEFFDKSFKKYKGSRKHLESIKTKLSLYPDRYGKPLSGRLHGVWQERMGPFRIWYTIDADKQKVFLIDFKHKDEAKKRY